MDLHPAVDIIMYIVKDAKVFKGAHMFGRYIAVVPHPLTYLGEGKSVELKTLVVVLKILSSKH